MLGDLSDPEKITSPGNLSPSLHIREFVGAVRLFVETVQNDQLRSVLLEVASRFERLADELVANSPHEPRRAKWRTSPLRRRAGAQQLTRTLSRKRIALTDAREAG